MFRVGGLALLVTLAVLLAPAGVFGGVIRNDVSDSQYLSYGASQPLACVGKLDYYKGYNHYAGSATLVSDMWVLTAAHCVEGMDRITVTLGGQSYEADNWVVCPGWTGDLAAGYDLALIQLTQPVENVSPAVLYTGGDELGETATMAGYGLTGTGLTGSTRYDLRKRAGTNVIDELRADGRLMMVDFDSPAGTDSQSGSAVPTPMEFLVAPGDSGGGLFVMTEDGLELAGVHSFIEAPDGTLNSDYGDLSGHVRVAYFSGWIFQTIGLAQAPEPGTALLVAVGAVALLSARRKRRR